MAGGGFKQIAAVLLLLGAMALAGIARADERDGGADASVDATSDGAHGSSTGGPEVPPPPPAPVVRITGTAVLPDDVARAAVGAPPGPDANVQAWGILATWRIVVAYRERGYLYARAWFSDVKQPGVLWFDVDEGRMRVSFVGMGSITATLFRLRLNLPGGVFQKQEFERSLAEQRKAFKLVDVNYRVHELEGYDVTIFGDVVPARTLEIHVARRESFGWALDVSVSAAWGVVPSLKYSASNVLLPDDRLFLELDIAVPYRRYVFDAAPRTTWVHGGLVASYRLPSFAHYVAELSRLAPRVDLSAYLSQYARADLKLTSFYLLRDVTVANVEATWRNVVVSLGIGADLARVFFLQVVNAQAGQQSPDPPSDVYSARGLVRAAANWTSALPWSRRDRRTFLNLLVDVSFPMEIRSTLSGQYFWVWGRHRVFLRGRGVAFAGQVPFWDDVELAGQYQRVFFGDLYWVHTAAQFEVAYLVKLWRDWFEIGLFHDTSVFKDRISSPASIRIMDAFGPSLHFLILDQYALSLHQGLGFAPGKFGQTISFTVESVF